MEISVDSLPRCIYTYEKGRSSVNEDVVPKDYRIWKLGELHDDSIEFMKRVVKEGEVIIKAILKQIVDRSERRPTEITESKHLEIEGLVCDSDRRMSFKLLKNKKEE